MISIASTLGPTTYWYLTRATGAVALVLLTISVCLGILGSVRFSAPRWPRFAVDTVHRDVSLLAVVLIVLHVVTTVLDGFAPINLVDGLIPFLSPYRTLWLGLGTLSFDLIIALVISSLLRVRLGYQSWRAIHWLAYLSWPVAVLHGLGTGTDTKEWWMLLLTVLCIGAVIAAVLSRINAVDRSRGMIRGAAFTLAVIAPVGIGVFTVAGPLAHGWARTAGTPANLLGHSTKTTEVPVSSGSSSSSTKPSDPVAQSFTASLSGNVSQQTSSAGAIVQLLMNVRGGIRGRLRVRLGGQPLQGGGLTLTGSQVDLSVAGVPDVFEGRVSNLEGDRFVARVLDSAGSALNIDANLTINQSNRTVSGTLSGAPAGGR